MASLRLTDTYNGKVTLDNRYVGHIEYMRDVKRYNVPSLKGCEYGLTFDEMLAYFHSYNWRSILGKLSSEDIKRKYEPHRVNVHKKRWSKG